jgi:hypothetical protein
MVKAFSLTKSLKDNAKVAAGGRPVHPRIKQMLVEEFLELLRLSSAAPQPKHGIVHHILTDSRLVFAKACWLEPANR